MKKNITISLAMAFAMGSSQAATVLGGVDPTSGSGTQTDSASNFIAISNQFTHTTTVAEVIDLSTSTFSFDTNGNTSASATPFLAIQATAGSHTLADYDVIWIGSGLAAGASAGTDVSASLGSGTFTLPASSNIVAGFFGAQSPVSADFGTTAGDVLIIAQGSVDVTNDITLSGSDWSTNTGVNNRQYYYEVNLMPVPEPSSTLLAGLAGLTLLFRRRK